VSLPSGMSLVDWMSEIRIEVGQEWDSFSVAEKLLHKAASDDRKRHNSVPQSGSRIDEQIFMVVRN
jgi:hypothetical protein